MKTAEGTQEADAEQESRTKTRIKQRRWGAPRAADEHAAARADRAQQQ
jgi:hypothetical protein